MSTSFGMPGDNIISYLTVKVIADADALTKLNTEHRKYLEQLNQSHIPTRNLAAVTDRLARTFGRDLNQALSNVQRLLGTDLNRSMLILNEALNKSQFVTKSVANDYVRLTREAEKLAAALAKVGLSFNVKDVQANLRGAREMLGEMQGRQRYEHWWFRNLPSAEKKYQSVQGAYQAQADMRAGQIAQL